MGRSWNWCQVKDKASVPVRCFTVHFFRLSVDVTSHSMIRSLHCYQSAMLIPMRHPLRDVVAGDSVAWKSVTIKAWHFRRKISNWAFKGMNVKEPLAEETSHSVALGCSCSLFSLLSHFASCDCCCFGSSYSRKKGFIWTVLEISLLRKHGQSMSILLFLLLFQLSC